MDECQGRDGKGQGERESSSAEASALLSQAELSEFNDLHQSTYGPVSPTVQHQ